MISLAETILIVRLVHKQDLQQPVPAWLRHLVLERVTLLLCLGSSRRLEAPQPPPKPPRPMTAQGETGMGESHVEGNF